MLLQRANNSTRRVLAFVLLWAVAGAAVAADWTYGVRPGDDLWRLAAKYCGSTSYATRIAKHNGLSSPKALQAGTRLNIPVEWLVRQPAEVEVKSVSGEVSGAEGQALAAGDRILMGQRVVTADGFAVVIFADGSVLEIGKNSEVLFNVLTSFGDTGMVDSHLRFYKGRGAARVVKRNTPSKFRIWTPTGIAAVRGTDFRVGSQGSGSAAQSRVETVTGAVDFEQSAQVLALPAGFGAVASPAGTNKEALLDAPLVADTGRSIWQANQSVQWQPVAQATKYQTKLYQVESGDLRPVRSASQVDTSYSLANLDPGQYAFSVRAVASSGLEGFDNEFRLRMGTLAPRPGSTNRLLPDDALRWHAAAGEVTHLVEIDKTQRFESPRSYSVDGVALALDDTQAHSPGVYYWRVRSADSAFSETQRLEVRPQLVERLEARQQPVADRKSGTPVPIALSWVQREQETYALVVRSAANPSASPVFAQRGIDSDTIQTPPIAPGRYTVEMVATSDGVSSDPAVQEIVVKDAMRWWPPGLLLLPVLFLL